MIRPWRATSIQMKSLRAVDAADDADARKLTDVEAPRSEPRSKTTTHNTIIRNRFKAYVTFHAMARGYPSNGFPTQPSDVSETALPGRTISHLEATRALQPEDI